MNILFLSNKKIWRGVSTWMLKVALGLEERGHNSFILANKENPFWQKEHKSIESNNFKIRFDFDPFTIFKVTKFIADNKIDLVVVNNPREIQVGGSAALTHKIPCLRRIGRKDDFREKKKDRYYHQKLIQYNVTPCKATAKEIESQFSYVNEGDIDFIHNGINPIVYNSRWVNQRKSDLGISPDELVVGSTVSFVAEKGLLPLLISLSKIKKEISPFRFVLFGKGSLESLIRRRVEELGLSKHVLLAGFSNNSAMDSSIFDIAVLNSTTEGFPNTLLEYFASGRPSICTDVGGVSEIARNRKNCLLIESGDNKTLQACIIKLAKDKELRIDLGQEAHNDIRTRFNESILVDTWEEYFLNAIKNNKS